MIPLVSIIIPVYNTEDRIEKCIRSIQQQSLQEIEIIAVNDGSTDDSLETLEKLAAFDPRIRILNGSNGGAASARNKGLGVASGKYIGFVDSDDWIEQEMFASLIEPLETSDVDVVVCDIQKESENHHVCLNIKKSETRTKNILKDLILFAFDFSLCNKLYRREIIQAHKISFDEQLRIGQDVLFNLYYFSVITKLSILPGAFYHYVSKPGSLMTRPQSERIESFNFIIKAFHQFCNKKNLKECWLVFSDNIGPGYQKYFLNLVLNSAETKPLNFIKYYKHVLSHLRLMDPLLLQNVNAIFTFQKIRMDLLNPKTFKLFSFLAAIRHKTFFS